MAMSNADVATSWVKGLAGDWAILEQLSSPSMRVWHSHDNMWLTREQGAARMADAAVEQAESGANAAPPSFDELSFIVTETGFVVKAFMQRLGAHLGRTHIVQICTVDDGLVASCEEYVAPEMTLR